MGTWTPGVPYTDPDPDQITTEVNNDAVERVTEAGEAAADALIDQGLGIEELDIYTAVLLNTDTALYPATVNGDAVAFNGLQLMAAAWGNGRVRTITDTYTTVPGDTSIVGGKATGFNVAVHNVGGADLAIPPIRILQSLAGQITVVNGTLASVVVTGTGRAKSRAQWSLIWVIYVLDFSGTSLWTVFGDTANA